MRCVQCGYMEDKVIDSRMSRDGTCIRRRRECLRCNYRYTTYEQVERTELRVVKRDNVHEALNREKILRGMIKACEKRPVSMDQLDIAADEIVAELHRDHQREVPSSIIGMKVIEKLQAIDPVAYIRYVSVYRQFSNVDEFIDLVRKMERKTINDPLQGNFHWDDSLQKQQTPAANRPLRDIRLRPRVAEQHFARGSRASRHHPAAQR